MGICASCLGYGRDPSQDGDLDRILASEPPSYGAFDHHDPNTVQPDEEELRQEREVIDQIATHAADHMIDIMRPGQSAFTGETGGDEGETQDETPADDEVDEDEAAWLASVEHVDLGLVRNSKSAPLVTNVDLIRT